MSSSHSRTALPLAPTVPDIAVYAGDLEEDVRQIRTIAQANAITGGLSKPSKMPEYGYSIPATECQVGGRLQQVRGSVCHRCYALTNRYRMPAVQRKMRQRFESLPHPLWVPAMVLLIRRRAIAFFRWHDSGDVQSVSHQLNVARIAAATPETRHWQPTREIEYVRGALGILGAFAPNHLVRVSAHLIGGQPPAFEHTSTVTASRPPEGSYVCPAPDQGNRCNGEVEDCRACWDPGVRNVVYWLH